MTPHTSPSLATWCKVNELLLDKDLSRTERALMVAAAYGGITINDAGTFPYSVIADLYERAKAWAQNPGGKLHREFTHEGTKYVYQFSFDTAPVAQWIDLEAAASMTEDEVPEDESLFATRVFQTFALLVSPKGEPYNGMARLKRVAELQGVPANIALPILGDFMRPTANLWASIRLSTLRPKAAAPRTRLFKSLLNFTNRRTTY